MENAAFVDRRPYLEHMIDSQALYSQPNFKGQARQKIFGADEVHLPIDLSIFRQFDQMNEKQLLDLNVELCKKYEEEVIRERREARQEATTTGESASETAAGLVYGQPWLGPTLQKKPGKYRFNERD